MKLITAIVRQDRLEALADAMVAAGARGLTVTDVRGFGRQYGQLAAAHLAGVRKVEFLPKVRLEVLVHDSGAAALVQEIAKQSETGDIGDGKIWVTPVEGALRIRTGERDDDAL
jgi:nitrogen regulatory protein P-II 1